jgi:hypothetical protein
MPFGRRIIAVSSGLVIAAFAATLLAPGGLELRVTPVEGGAPLLVGPIRPGERFTLRYYHSVENAPIWEVHSVDSRGRIYIEEERYLKFGAGMGRMPGVGRMVRKGPYEAVTDMHMPTGDFILRIGNPGVDHTVFWRGTETNLSALAPHTAVRFTVRPVNLLCRLWRIVFPHPAAP